MLSHLRPHPSPLNLRIYYLTWHREFANGIKNLELGRLFWTMQVHPRNHKSHYKRELSRSTKRKRRYDKKRKAGRILKIKEGAMNQRLQMSPKARKKQRNRFFSRASRKNTTLPIPGFHPDKTPFGILTSRIVRK